MFCVTDILYIFPFALITAPALCHPLVLNNDTVTWLSYKRSWFYVWRFAVLSGSFLPQHRRSVCNIATDPLQRTRFIQRRPIVLNLRGRTRIILTQAKSWGTEVGSSLFPPVFLTSSKVMGAKQVYVL